MKQIKPGNLDPELEKLLESSRSHVITPQEQWAQRVSWAYGNVSLHNPDVTREEVEEQARLLGFQDVPPGT